MSDLAKKKCAPCSQGTLPMRLGEIEEHLEQVSSEWSVVDEQELERELIFEDFSEAMDFLNKLAKVAEAEGHHPDFCLHDYKKVSVTLTTHKIKGLSENDFIMAAKIDEMLENDV